MMLTTEKVLLTVIGIAMIVFMLDPLSGQMKVIEEQRNMNCVNAALRAVDLAITNSIGGGVAEGYAFLPAKVSYECKGGEVKLTAGNSSASLKYPFRLLCGGEAYLAGKFYASWERDVDGEATLVLSWVRG